MSATLVGQGQFYCLGETLWDVLPQGEFIGGAPFNVAAHLTRLGCAAQLVTRIGADDRGQRTRARLRALGMNERCVQIDSDLPTGTAEATLRADGSADYFFKAPAAFDALAVPAWPLTGCLVFGSLGCRDDRARATIDALLRQADYRVLDLNLRAPFDANEVIDWGLQRCDFLKVNDQELMRLTAMCALPCDSRALWTLLQSRVGLQALMVTYGADGAELYWQGTHHRVEAVPSQVVDTIGAGDAFLAQTLKDLSQGVSADSALHRASVLASWVVAAAGAIPDVDLTQLPPAR